MKKVYYYHLHFMISTFSIVLFVFSLFFCESWILKVAVGLEALFAVAVQIAIYRKKYLAKHYLSSGDKISLENSFISICEENSEIIKLVLDIYREDTRSRFFATKQEAQIIALQNQINPHFLYNTLETIRSDAMTQGVESIAYMSEALANFFRYSISNLDQLVQVQDELANVKSYYLIQHYRFGNKLKLEIEYSDDKSILSLYIPKLIMQPLVENAIYHGIEEKFGSGTVQIHMERTIDRLYITISDDGIGISPSVLDELNDSLEKGSQKSKSGNTGTGIAIGNVNKRIKLLFGNEFGVYIRSIVDIGTDIHLTLPVLEKTFEEQNHGY